MNDPILDAYSKLASDRKSLDTLYANKDQTAATVSAASSADATASSELFAGVSAFEASKAALVKLIQDGLNSGPPVVLPSNIG